MIKLFHVNKSYREGYPILEDINLHIEKGEFLSLTGPSGAGKTTLLKLIFCEEYPDSGQLLIDGRNISRLSRRETARLRRSIGVVFQDFKLIDNQSVFENVAMRLEILGVRASEVKQRVSLMLSLVGLEELADKSPSTLSGGEQQRVAIARALINDPKILLADEPTGNLDLIKAIEILELLKEINMRGTTVLMVTHNQSLVERFSRRHIKIDDGKLVGP